MSSAASIINRYTKKLNHFVNYTKRLIFGVNSTVDNNNNNSNCNHNSSSSNNNNNSNSLGNNPIQIIYEYLSKLAASQTFSMDIYSPENSEYIKKCLLVMNNLNLSHVGLEDLSLNQIKRSACMGIQNNENFEMAIFILPKGAILPLHDHPNMTVLSKILLGRLHLQGFSRNIENNNYYVFMNNNEQSNSNVLQINQQIQTSITENCEKSISDSAWYLSPSNSNIHQFVALETCVIFDVLVPPYCFPNRPCNYYAFENETDKVLNINDNVLLKVISEPSNILPIPVKYNGYKPTEKVL